jgi:hypothetical protein
LVWNAADRGSMLLLSVAMSEFAVFWF